MLKRQQQRQIRRRLQRRHLRRSQLLYQAILQLQLIPLNLERARHLQKAHQRRRAHPLRILKILLDRHRHLQRARLLKGHHLPLQRELRLLQRQILQVHARDLEHGDNYVSGAGKFGSPAGDRNALGRSGFTTCGDPFGSAIDLIRSPGSVQSGSE